MPEKTNKKYTVRKALHHDGQDYLPGQPIELQQETADYLLRRGSILDPTAPKKAAAAKKPTTGGEA